MTRKAIRNHGAPARPAVPSTPRIDEPAFETVPRRPRHDGWTPDRQVAFIEALAECGCVDEACARVGMSKTAAYALRRVEAAHSFRRAWDMALDHAIRRLADAAFSRAIKGVERPIFYKGEQVGVRVHHDERLAMFLLRYREPDRYGAWIDACEAKRPPDGAALDLGEALRRVGEDAVRADAGDTRVLDWTPPFPLHVARPDPKAHLRGTVHPRMTQEEVDAKLSQVLDRVAAQVKAKRARAGASGVAMPATS